MYVMKLSVIFYLLLSSESNDRLDYSLNDSFIPYRVLIIKGSNLIVTNNTGQTTLDIYGNNADLSFSLGVFRKLHLR